MKMLRFRRLALVTSLLGAGTLALSAAPSYAAAAAAVGSCGGPVLAQVGTSGWAAAPVTWECTDSGSGRMGAYGSFSGSSFSGTYYDNYCSGSVHGTIEASQLVGFVNVTCGGVARSGPFVLDVVGLEGTMSVTR